MRKQGLHQLQNGNVYTINEFAFLSFALRPSGYQLPAQLGRRFLNKAHPSRLRMGVKDLWKLLEPAGRPVKLETLEGLVVGVGKYQLSGYQAKEE